MEIDAEKSELGREAEGIPISISHNGTIIRAPIVRTTVAQATVSCRRRRDDRPGWADHQIDQHDRAQGSLPGGYPDPGSTVSLRLDRGPETRVADHSHAVRHPGTRRQRANQVPGDGPHELVLQRRARDPWRGGPVRYHQLRHLCPTGAGLLSRLRSAGRPSPQFPSGDRNAAAKRGSRPRRSAHSGTVPATADQPNAARRFVSQRSTWPGKSGSRAQLRRTARPTTGKSELSPDASTTVMKSRSVMDHARRKQYGSSQKLQHYRSNARKGKGTDPFCAQRPCGPFRQKGYCPLFHYRKIPKMSQFSKRSKTPAE